MNFLWVLTAEVHFVLAGCPSGGALLPAPHDAGSSSSKQPWLGHCWSHGRGRAGLVASSLESDQYEKEEKGEESNHLSAVKSWYKGGIEEGGARIHSSDSVEGSEEGKAQRLLKAKELTSEDVAEPSRKTKAEDDNKANKKHKK